MSGSPLPARADAVVIGAGIVGLATARALAIHGRRVAVVDKEVTVAAHQTGRNSGVLHSGLYYRPGSLKATTAIAGREAIVAYCRERGIAHEICGKVVVATRTDELARLEDLRVRGEQNGLAVRRISASELAELEPHATGLAALHVPETGIVDFVAVTRELAKDVLTHDGSVTFEAPVVGIREHANEVVVETTAGDVEGTVVVNCAGLQSDRIAALHGQDDGTRIVPFRGEYFHLKPERSHLVRNLIYPVPDPRFPFLGVHFTRTVHGGVHVGPNAVPALAREGYSWRDVDRHDVAEVARNRAFWKLARQYWRVGTAEIARSLSRRAFVRALQRLVPEVTVDDLVPAPAGVRAQALSRDGALLDDFAIEATTRAVHVVNAPSPAATASLEIGRLVAEMAQDRLG